jgi:hypothetical protein
VRQDRPRTRHKQVDTTEFEQQISRAVADVAASQVAARVSVVTLPN